MIWKEKYQWWKIALLGFLIIEVNVWGYAVIELLRVIAGK